MRAVWGLCGAGCLLLAGCASPGTPLPPTLKLPEPVTDLTAARVGDGVRLHWTTPERTTDRVKIAGAITAEICRETRSSVPAASSPGATATGPMGPTPAANSGGQGRAGLATEPRPACVPMGPGFAVHPGESEAVDALPPTLATGRPGVLAYRVQLRNDRGRTAGPSGFAYAASGAAPPRVEPLRVTAAKAGAVLEWPPEPAGAEDSNDVVEVDRLTIAYPAASGPATTSDLQPAPKAATGAARATKPRATETKSGSQLAPARQPREVRFRVGQPGAAGNAGDPGGAVDRTAQVGMQYRYSAQRVRTVELGARLELRSPPSAAVQVAMLDVFAPDAPAGFVAAPGSSGNAASGLTEVSIDLSWEPVDGPRVVGYRVYRREGEGAWQRLPPAAAPEGNAERTVAAPADRDLTVQAGHRYAYRVTAVDAAGHESPPSAVAEETAPTP